MKEAVVLPLGKSSAGVRGGLARPFPLFRPHFGPDLLEKRVAMNRICQELDRRAKPPFDTRWPCHDRAWGLLGL